MIELVKKYKYFIVLLIVSIGISSYTLHSINYTEKEISLLESIQENQKITIEDKFFYSIPLITFEQLNKPLDEGKIIYENNAKIYSLDTKSKKSSLLLDINLLPGLKNEIDKINKINEINIDLLKLHPSEFSLSDDKRYLFFKIKFDPFSFSNLPKIYVFDLFKNKLTSAIDINEDYWFNSSSLNGKYVILQFSTCPCDALFAVADINEGRTVYEMTGSFPIWSPDNLKISYSKSEAFIGAPIGADVYTHSIQLINIEDEKEQTLIKATNQQSYNILYWEDENHIVCSMDKYREPIPINSEINYPNEETRKKYEDIFENPETTYWIINIKTGELQQINQDNVLDKTKNILSYLEKSKKFDRYIPFSPNREWEVLIRGFWPNGTIYIF